MPIPKRKPDEDRNDFLSRCMSDSTMNKEYPESSQRYAVCLTSSKGSQEQQIKDAYYDNTFGSTEIITEDNFYIPKDSDYIDLGETTEEWDIAKERPGLWENIRKKKEREGKNYKPAKPGDPDRPTPDQLKRAQSKYKYKDIETNEIFLYDRMGVYRKNDRVLMYVGKAEDESTAVQYGKPPKNDPRKTPAPKKDQKKGSKKNKPDSAKDDKGNITFNESLTKRLQSLVTEHNKKDKGSKVTLGMLKAVYRRGAGAFSTSHAPKMSRDGWAIARVNAFLYLMRNGRPSNPNYKQDNDLLPKSHPRSTKAEYEDNSMQVSQIKKMHQQLMMLDKILDNISVDFEEWTKDKISKAEHFIQEIYDAVLYSKHEDDEEDTEEEGMQPELFERDDSPPQYGSEYQGRKVQLNKPFRTPDGPKKFSVYVKNEKGNVVKVNFGDPTTDIKRDDPARRKSFRARHRCDTDPGPRWKARFWSCRQWRSNKKVED